MFFDEEIYGSEVIECLAHEHEIYYIIWFRQVKKYEFTSSMRNKYN